MSRCLLLLLLIPTFSYAQAPDSGEVLRVGVKESPPFVIQQPDGSWTGISVTLWNEVAEELELEYEYREFDLQALVQAVEQGQVDLSINPLTVTSERLRKVDFTQPFYITNLAIATQRDSRQGWLVLLENFFSIDFLKAVLLLFLVILIFGVLAWLFERNRNQEQFDNSPRGIWQGIWWSAVTMTTVGYGDKSPVTVGGRIVALVWMFTAIIIISGFTAAIASSLTVGQIQAGISSPDDLQDVRVAGVAGSTGEGYLTNEGLRYQSYDSEVEALQALANEEVDALVYDEPILRYMIKSQQMQEELVVLPYQFNTQYYSFSLPRKNELLKEIDPVLVDHINSLEWKALLQRYNLGEK